MLSVPKEQKLNETQLEPESRTKLHTLLGVRNPSTRRFIYSALQATTVVCLSVLLWWAFRRRFFLPEMRLVSLAAIAGFYAPQLIFWRGKRWYIRTAGLALYMFSILILVFLVSPDADQSFERAHLAHTIIANGGEYTTAGEVSSHLIRLPASRTGFLIPKKWGLLFGGPAFFEEIDCALVPLRLVDRRTMDTIPHFYFYVDRTRTHSKLTELKRQGALLGDGDESKCELGKYSKSISIWRGTPSKEVDAVFQNLGIELLHFP
jgi:hypothetical protein